MAYIDTWPKLAGGIPTPLKNISQLGWLFPIYGKIKNVPNHQPENKHCCLQQSHRDKLSGICWQTGGYVPAAMCDYRRVISFPILSHLVPPGNLTSLLNMAIEIVLLSPARKLWCSVVFWCFLYVYQRVTGVFSSPADFGFWPPWHLLAQEAHELRSLCKLPSEGHVDAPYGAMVTWWKLGSCRSENPIINGLV